MNNLFRKTTTYYNEYYIEKTWLLNLYVIQSNEKEKITYDSSKKIVEKFLKEIEKNHLSDEFTYFRTGFAFLHYGSRGIDLNIWHIGQWGNTYEIFNCSWYCYNRNLSLMENLDDAEPIMSQYEILYLNSELKSIASIIENLTDECTFRSEYFKLNQYNLRS